MSAEELLRDVQRRLLAAVALTVPLVVVSAQAARLQLVPQGAAFWVQLLLALLVVFGCGSIVVADGMRGLRKRRPETPSLVTLSAIGLIGYSVLVVLAPRRFALGCTQHGEAGLYFAAAAAVVCADLACTWSELRLRWGRGTTLRRLQSALPASARRIGANGLDEEVPLADVAAGDLLVVPPETAIPADGRIVEGESIVDDTPLSGADAASASSAGQRVYAGALNRDAALVVEVSQVGNETLLGRIVALASTARASLAPVDRLAQETGIHAAGLAIALAGIAVLVWCIADAATPTAHLVVIGAATLIVAAPCAFRLASPLSMALALDRGLRRGLLFRDAGSVQRVRTIDTVVFDMPGTLTVGRPELVSLVPAAGISDVELLGLASGLAGGDSKSSAVAITSALFEGGRSGAGIAGRVGAHQVAIGNEAHMCARGADSAALIGEARELRQRGETVAFVARDARVVGLLGFVDPLAPAAWDAVRRMRADGLRLVVVSGDHEQTARPLAARLGIDAVFGAATAQRKADIVRALRADGRKVAFVGDARDPSVGSMPANLRIAVGALRLAEPRAEAQVPEITLVGSELPAIVWARRVSRLTMRKVRYNLAFATLYALLAIPLAAGVLQLATGIVAAPIFAAIAMCLALMFVMLNSVRVRD